MVNKEIFEIADITIKIHVRGGEEVREKLSNSLVEYLEKFLRGDEISPVIIVVRDLIKSGLVGLRLEGE